MIDDGRFSKTDAALAAEQQATKESVERLAAAGKSIAEKYEELSRVTAALVKTLAIVHQTPEYKQVWELYRVHGLTYRGPTYERALTDVIDVMIAHRGPQP